MSEQLNNLMIDTVGDVTVVRFVGLSAMDLPAAESLLDVVARLPTPPRVALDFGHLLRLDRAVVEKLIHLRRRIQADGGVLTLHPLNPELLDLIRTTKSDRATDDENDGNTAGVGARLRPPRPSGGAAVALPPPPPADDGV